MTTRGLLLLAAAIALVIVALPLRDPAVAEAIIAKEAPARVESAAPAPMPDAGDDRTVAGADTVAAVAFFVYEVARSTTTDLDPADYRLVDTQGTTPWDEARSALRAVVDRSPRATHVVLDARGRRICLDAADVAGLTGAVLGALAAEARTELDVRAYDAATRQRLGALLVELSGRPLGPIAATDTRLWLPPVDAYRVLAPGYAPARLWLPQAGNVAFADLHAAAWASGRVGGVPFESGELWLHDLHDPHEQRPPTVVAIGADGRFALGPVPVGPKALSFTSRDARLTKAHRQFELNAGRQDLGFLQLEPLHALHVRVTEDGRPFDGEAFFSIYIHGREKDMEGLAAIARGVRNGETVFEGYPRTRLAVAVWTGDGRFGAGPGDGVFAESTSAAAPVRIELAPAAALTVHVSAPPFGVPAGSKVLVCPSLYHLHRNAPLDGNGVHADERVRRTPVPAGGVARFDACEATEHHIALVAPWGTILAVRAVSLVAGEQATIDLAPEGPLAAIDVRCATAQAARFAVLSEQDGLVLRGAANAAVSRFVLPPGEYGLRVLSAGSPVRPLALPAGQVVSVELD